MRQPSLSDVLDALRGNAPGARADFTVHRDVDATTSPWTEEITYDGATLQAVIANPKSYRLVESISITVDAPDLPRYTGERDFLGPEEYARRQAELAQRDATP